MARKRIQAFAFRTVSQTGIHYRSGPLSETLDGIPGRAPRAGDRFPWLRLEFEANGVAEDSFRRLDDMHFNLVVVGQPAPAPGGLGLGDLVRVHVLPADPVNEAELARARIPQPSFYLLRPDGHVGLCGARLEAAAVKMYVSERLHLQAKSG